MATQEITPKEKQEVTEAPETKAGRYYTPDVDIREDEQALWLWADMPGVKQDNISVDLDNGTLTVRGDVTLEEYEGLVPVYTEYNVGNFVRRFTLPSSSRLDVEGISARVANGVLEVRLPKTEQARQRRIPVKAA
jgi:HSP20 family molecular chaperone IbpA